MLAPNTFSGAGLDRAGERRTDGAWLAERLADAGSRAVVVGPDGVLVAEHAGDDPRPARLPLEHVEGELILLGLEDGHAIFAAHATTAEHPPGTRVLGLRDAGALLRQDDGGLTAY